MILRLCLRRCNSTLPPRALSYVKRPRRRQGNGCKRRLRRARTRAQREKPIPCPKGSRNGVESAGTPAGTLLQLLAAWPPTLPSAPGGSGMPPAGVAGLGVTPPAPPRGQRSPGSSTDPPTPPRSKALGRRVTIAAAARIAPQGRPNRLNPSSEVAFPVPGSARPSPAPRSFVPAPGEKQAVPGRPRCAIRENKDGEGNCPHGAARAGVQPLPPGSQLAAGSKPDFVPHRGRSCLFWRGEGWWLPPAALVSGSAWERANLAPSR